MKKTIGRGFLVGVLLFAVLVASFLIFTQKVETFNSDSVKAQLTEVAKNNAQLIRTMFGQDIRELENIAAYWDNNQSLTSEDSLRYLTEQGEATRYVRLGIDLLDGTSYTSDGYTVDVTGAGYLEQLSEGKPILTDVYTAEIGEGEVFAVVVPISQRGKVVGALRAVYNSSTMQDLVTMETFQGEGYLNIVNANGDFMIRAPKVNELYPDKNLFTYLESVTLDNKEAVQRLKNKMQKMEEGRILFSLPEEKHSACFVPIGLGKWYVFSAVPSNYWTEQRDQLNGAVGVLLLIIGFIYITLIIFILWQNKNTRNKIGAEKDYLQRVLNNIPLPVFIADEKRIISFLNVAAMKLFHISSIEEVKGKPCYCFGTDICRTENCAIEKMERTGIGKTYYEADQKGYMVSTAVLAKEAQTDGKYIEVIQDVTEIIQIQRDLEEKTFDLETINENISSGLLISKLDKQFTVLRCNKNYCDLVQAEEEKIIGKGAINFVAPEDQASILMAVSTQFEAGKTILLEHKILQSDGNRIWVTLRGKQTILKGEEVGVWLLSDSSEVHKAQNELVINLERYKIAMQNTTDILIDYDIITRKIYHSSKVTEIYGVPKLLEDAPECLVRDEIILEECAEDFLEIFKKIRAGEEKCACIIKTRALDGRIIWNRLIFTTIFDEEHKPVRAIGMMQDITREKMAETQYKRESRFRELGGTESAVYYEADLTNHRFVSGHESIVLSCKKEPTDDFDEVEALILQQMVIEADRELVESHIAWGALMESYEKGITHTTFEYRRNNGRENLWVECSLHIFQNEETNALHVVGCIRDINEKKLRELELQYKAERDLLTNLYNKVTLQRLISDTVITKSERSYGAFLLIDLDNFKKINDTMGHAFGDAVLVEVSKCLSERFKEGELTGRLGGDEFGIYLNNVQDREQITKIVEDVCKLFHDLYVGEEKYKVSATVGVSVFPEDGMSFEALYRHADEALYHAKKLGKDTFSFYESRKV